MLKARELQLDEMGIARRGLLVRHLVLPNQLAGTEVIIRFLAYEISKDTYLNLMVQYHPCFNAIKYPELNRPITRDEYQQTINQAYAYGLSRLDHKISHRN